MVDWINFHKPQRYLNGEWNAIKKPHSNKIKICVCYPDLYEVGMSNLGLRIVYGLLNSFDDVVCERAFLPGEDYFAYLRCNRKYLTSLETGVPLKEFDVVGFNLSYELNYVNVLRMLDAGGIEVVSSERKDTIVIGGGVANPESIAPFIDLFILGEFEEVAEDFLNVLRKYSCKEERLKALAEIEGFYVPSFYNVYRSKDKYCIEKRYQYAILPVRRVYVRDLDVSFYPVKWLTPYTSIVHDRAQIEIARGCPNKCKFCQARCLYFPYRQRKVETVKRLIYSIYRSSGYENLSLLALSASDYTYIEELLSEIAPYLEKNCIGLSLPSLRVEDALVGKLYRFLNAIKKVSATFAVEAATSDLREKIEKKINIDAIMETARILRGLNYKHIKLYFMFGFPFESEEDIKAIGQLVHKLQRVSGLRINFSANVFIPKPFSPFEDIEMKEESILYSRRRNILNMLSRNRNIKISISGVEESILEAVISRADREISKVIYRVFTSVRDGQRNSTDVSLWREAFSYWGIDMYQYLVKRDTYPWSHISLPAFCRDTKKE